MALAIFSFMIVSPASFQGTKGAGEPGKDVAFAMHPSIKPAYQIMLFDLDGTILNTNDLIIKSFQHTLNENLGLAVSAEELHPFFGEPLPVTLGRYAPERAMELTEFYRVYNAANHDLLIREFEGVKETLAALAEAGVTLGVVTSKRVDMARRGLRIGGLEPYFQTVVGFDDTDRHKPEPDPVLLALRRLGTEPGEHVLMVGDSTFDILCGKSAGVRTAAVKWSVQRDSLAAVNPDHWIEEPRDLLELAAGQAR